MLAQPVSICEHDQTSQVETAELACESNIPPSNYMREIRREKLKQGREILDVEVRMSCDVCGCMIIKFNCAPGVANI